MSKKIIVTVLVLLTTIVSFAASASISKDQKKINKFWDKQFSKIDPKFEDQEYESGLKKCVKEYDFFLSKYVGEKKEDDSNSDARTDAMKKDMEGVVAICNGVDKKASESISPNDSANTVKLEKILTEKYAEKDENPKKNKK